MQQIYLEHALELSRYSLEENSPYARRQERNPLGGLDKEVFKGNRQILKVRIILLIVLIGIEF